MSRYFNMFLLHAQYVFERREVSLVWFLISLLNPLILLLYWRGALQNTTIHGWSLSSVSSYYFLLVIASAMLMSHIEDEVSHEDIEQGNLVRYLLRPFSYFWLYMIKELPYRLLQGGFGVIVCLLFVAIFGQFFQIASTIEVIALGFVSAILAYMLSFLYKMILGLSAFWLIDAKGFYESMEIITILFAGYVLPLDLMPSSFTTIAALTPFPYIIYFPVIILQGKLQIAQIYQVIIWQCVWIGIGAVLYQFLWRTGIKKFTGMGQ